MITSDLQAATENAFWGALCADPASRIPEARDAGVTCDWFLQGDCKLMWSGVEELLAKHFDLAGINNSIPIQKEANDLRRKKESPFQGYPPVRVDFCEKMQEFRKRDVGDPKKEFAGYLKDLADAYLGRETDKAIRSSAVDNIGDNKARAVDLLAKVQRALRSTSEDDEISLTDVLDANEEALDKADHEFRVEKNYNYVPGIPWPWEKLNRLTQGLNPGLHVIAARPSVGKTSFVLQCLVYWGQMGYRIGFDCLDMAVTEAMLRPVANLSGLSLNRRKSGRLNDSEVALWKRARAAVNRWAIHLKNEADVDRLKVWAENLHAAGKLDILIIDFAQRFRMRGSHGASEYETVTYAAGVLKQLANETLMPVILLSQLSRDNMKAKDGPRPPELSDLRGSGALEQDATSVVLLHKDDEMNKIWKAINDYGEESKSELAPQSIEALRVENEALEKLLPHVGDTEAIEETKGAMAAVCYNLAKNQNGPTGEVPFIVYQNSFRWFVADSRAGGKARFHKLTLDWRARHGELKNATEKEVAIIPNHWENKYIEELGKLGMPLSETIKAQAAPWSLDRYEKLLAERNARLGKTEGE